MTEKDLDSFSTVLATACNLYGVEMTEAQLELWFELFKNYTVEEFDWATKRHLKDPDRGMFMPRPADLMRLLAGSGKSASLNAWAKVIEAMRNIGPWHSVAFDDALIHRALAEIGGWTWLCSQSYDQLAFIENRFVELYKLLRARDDQSAYPSHLVGLEEANNRTLSDCEILPPRVAGDPKKAAAVYQRGQSPSSMTRTLKAISQ